MLGLILGVFIGSFITIVIMSLMYMAKDPEPKKRESEQKEPECKEPTTLWSVGNICKWGGEVHEIRFFRQDEDGQTLACIFLDGATTGICVPIEELEAVE